MQPQAEPVLFSHFGAETMKLCVKVLANRCHSVVDAIMAEEDAAEGSKS